MRIEDMTTEEYEAWIRYMSEGDPGEIEEAAVIAEYEKNVKAWVRGPGGRSVG